MPQLEEIYDSKFFNDEVDVSMQSAEIVAPLICDLLNVSSAVDVGCGLGHWLLAMANLGVPRILGVDGPHVDRSRLKIPKEMFKSHDLRNSLPDFGRFDIAMSLEVAEHLPSKCAEGFIAGLIRLAPVVVFSAAIPGQGGTNHVNEQWPEYWEALFREHGFIQLDPLRPLIWQDERVLWWYRQNLFIYAERSLLDSESNLKFAPRGNSPDRLTLVSRRVLQANMYLENNLGLRAALGLIPKIALRAFKNRFSFLLSQRPSS